MGTSWICEMKRLLLTGIAALFLVTGTAHSWDSRQTPFGKAYFSGILGGLVAAAAALKKEQLFCPPDNLTLTGEMLEDIMRKYGDEHPELRSRDIPIPIGALAALQWTFPCKSQ